MSDKVRQIVSHIADSLSGRTESGHVLLWILRGSFGAIVISLAMLGFDYVNRTYDFISAFAVFVGVLAAGFSVVMTDVMVRSKQITTISAVYFGLLLGLLLGWLFSVALEPFAKDPLGPFLFQGLRLFITVVCCYVSVSVLVQTKDEFRFIIPYVEFSKQVKGGKPLVLDTSVIIDGRIADICDTRFIDTKMIVPRFVLQELQAIADSSDKLKRNRGRAGWTCSSACRTTPRLSCKCTRATSPNCARSTRWTSGWSSWPRPSARGW